MKITLYTEGTFDAAHLVKGHPGKCSVIHGHTWKIEAWVSGDETELNEIGILWDFGNMKEIVDQFDHKNLNDILDVNPTAENLSLYIYKSQKNKHPNLNFKIRVYENFGLKKSYAEVGE